MRKLLTSIVFVVLTTVVSGQTLKSAPNGLSMISPYMTHPVYIIQADPYISNYDTTVLHKGDVACSHSYVSEKKGFSTSSCLVMHGPEGCPDSWLNEKSICTICLRHIHVKETRTAKPQPQDPYTEALRRLEEKLKKNNK